MSKSSAPQSEVLQWYNEHAVEASAVGDYVRVVSDRDIACFGTVGEIGEHGWRVVEINWDHHSFLLAPFHEPADEPEEGEA